MRALEGAGRPLSREEEYELLKRLPETAEELFRHNMRFVAFLVRRMFPESLLKSYTDAEEELIHSGYVGLLKAIRNFNLEKGGKIGFQNYAAFWIKREVLRASRELFEVVHIPEYLSMSSLRRKAEENSYLRLFVEALEEGSVREELVEHLLQDTGVNGDLQLRELVLYLTLLKERGPRPMRIFIERLMGILEEGKPLPYKELAERHRMSVSGISKKCREGRKMLINALSAKGFV